MLFERNFGSYLIRSENKLNKILMHILLKKIKFENGKHLAHNFMWLIVIFFSSFKFVFKNYIQRHVFKTMKNYSL